MSPSGKAPGFGPGIRGFESLHPSHENRQTFRSGVFHNLGRDPNPRFCAAKDGGFGAVNEAKESTKYFLERVNGGGFSR